MTTNGPGYDLADFWQITPMTFFILKLRRILKLEIQAAEL